MSITKFQDRLFNKGGCGTAILIGCAAVMGAFVFQYFGRANMYDQQDAQGHPTRTIATIDGTPIQSGPIEQAFQQIDERARQQGQPGMSSPDEMARAYGLILGQSLDMAAIPAVAKSLGIQFTDDQLRQAEKARLQQSIDSWKMQAEMGGKLKFGATDAEASAAFKAQNGKSIEEAEKDAVGEFDATLQDASKRQEVIAGLGRPMLTAALAGKINASDADVKAGFNQYTFKRILLAQKPAPSPSVADRIAIVQKDLAAGTPFEKEMNRFSDDPPKAKQTVSESTQVYTADQLTAEKSLAPLKSLKVDGVSAPIVYGEGTSIYKLISVKPQVPADFAKGIANYRKQYQEKLASAALEDRIKSVIASDTKWQSAGYQAVYNVTQPDAGTKAKELYEQSKAAVQKTEGYDLRPAELAEYVSFNLIWSAPGADHFKLRPERIQVLNDFLSNMENFEVRMELVRLYEADRNGKLAAASLLQAASANNSYDNIGLRNFGDVNASLITLKSEGLLDAASEKSIQDIQAQWTKDKTSYDKEQADEKAAEAKARAEEEADRKKAEAQTKAAQQSTAPVKPGTAPAAGPGSAPSAPTKGGSSPSGTGNGSVKFPPGVLPPSGGSKG